MNPAAPYNMLDYNVIIHYAACEHGAVQLADGGYSFEGRLEVCVNGLWGTICDTDWSKVESSIVCNQLGFLAFGKSHQYVPIHELNF